MELEIDIISTEVVTPSSPTPHNLKHYLLSLIDQIMGHGLTPAVFFYLPNNNLNLTTISERSNLLKRSLSQTLTLYYPLAGRLVDNSYVNCNDKGVTYIEAQANYNCKLFMDEFTGDSEELNKFFPIYDPLADICMNVQATFFRCGGLALGLRVSHKISDAFSILMFINSWAAAATSRAHVQSPIFEGATLFPPRKELNVLVATDKKEIKIVRKRFLFTTQKIADLRDKYTSNDGLNTIHPTIVQALSTFIWTRFMVATGAKDDISKVYVLRFAVDTRKRMVPPLSEYHFGNIIMPAITAIPSLNGDKEDAAGYGIVKKIRDATRNIDGNYIARKICEVNNPFGILADKQVLDGEEVIMFTFSSAIQINPYKADFGWGIPDWVTTGKTWLNHMVHFFSISSGDGIEAWVNLKQEDMIKFEQDKELLRYVSCGPHFNKNVFVKRFKTRL